ncbi:MAG: DUF433 domain-containing protein [Snowella sp.]
MELISQLKSEAIIHSDPEIMSGIPVFMGSRVPLQTFFDYLQGTEGFTEFINDFPYLEKQVIKILEIVAKLILTEEHQNNAYLAR